MPAASPDNFAADQFTPDDDGKAKYNEQPNVTAVFAVDEIEYRIPPGAFSGLTHRG